MKKGSFDNYILNSNPKHIDSKFGIYIRNLMRKKQKDPKFPLPIIPGHNTVRRAAKGGKYWEKKNFPTIYAPNKYRLQDDKTEWYIKTPQEMSRHELAELEAELKEIATAGGEEEEVQATEEQMAEMRKDPKYVRYFEKIKRLQKIRHNVIKRYFDMHKYKRNTRNEIIQAAEDSEE